MKINRKRSVISAESLCKLCHLALVELEKTKYGQSKRIEKKFQAHLGQILQKQNRKFEDEVDIKDVGGKIFDPTRKSGFIDFVIGGSAGVEIKVLSAPKHPKRRSPSHAIWDLGQITIDAIRLKYSKKLNSRFLVWLITGEELKIYSSSSDLRRYMHNRLFVDFIDSSKPGFKLHISSRENKRFLRLRGLQRKIIRELGLDTTFERSSKISQVKIRMSKKYAVMVLDLGKR